MEQAGGTGTSNFIVTLPEPKTKNLSRFRKKTKKKTEQATTALAKIKSSLPPVGGGSGGGGGGVEGWEGGTRADDPASLRSDPIYEPEEDIGEIAEPPKPREKEEVSKPIKKVEDNNTENKQEQDITEKEEKEEKEKEKEKEEEKNIKPDVVVAAPLITSPPTVGQMSEIDEELAKAKRALQMAQDNVIKPPGSASLKPILGARPRTERTESTERTERESRGQQQEEEFLPDMFSSIALRRKKFIRDLGQILHPELALGEPTSPPTSLTPADGNREKETFPPAPEFSDDKLQELLNSRHPFYLAFFDQAVDIFTDCLRRSLKILLFQSLQKMVTGVSASDPPGIRCRIRLANFLSSTFGKTEELCKSFTDGMVSRQFKPKKKTYHDKIDEHLLAKDLNAFTAFSERYGVLFTQAMAEVEKKYKEFWKVFRQFTGGGGGEGGGGEKEKERTEQEEKIIDRLIPDAPIMGIPVHITAEQIIRTYLATMRSAGLRDININSNITSRHSQEADALITDYYLLAESVRAVQSEAKRKFNEEISESRSVWTDYAKECGRARSQLRPSVRMDIYCNRMTFCRFRDSQMGLVKVISQLNFT